MNALQRRIKAVEREMKIRKGGLFTVHYKDGSTRTISPGDAILLTLNESEQIERFEESESRASNGILEGLVNALLPGYADERKDGEQ